jgi:hypothetical protein
MGCLLIDDTEWPDHSAAVAGQRAGHDGAELWIVAQGLKTFENLGEERLGYGCQVLLRLRQKDDSQRGFFLSRT